MSNLRQRLSSFVPLALALPLTACPADPGSDDTASGGTTSGSTGEEASDTIPNPTTSGNPKTDPDTTTGASTGADETGSSSGGGSSSSDDGSGSSSGEGSSSSGGAPNTCGDGVVDLTEDCDDANADDLDGCLEDCRYGPIGIDYGLPVDLPLHGNVAGGTLFVDACPAGEVLLGIRGAASGWITRLRGVCGALQLVDTGSLGVSVTESTLLPERGLLAGAAFDATCPDDHVVVGFRGRSGGLVDQIVLSCAPIVISDDGVSIGLAVEVPFELPPVGGGGGDPFAMESCAAGTVASVTNIRGGDSIDAFGMACQSITLAF